MTLEDDPLEHERASWKPSPGLAVAVPDPVRDPELPPHRERVTDKDPAAMTRAVRTVYTLFYLSVAASIWAIAAYFLFPIEDGSIVAIRNNNLFIGLGIGLALLAIGIGAIHWSKAIMSDKEFVEPRHATRGRDTTRVAAAQAFADANEESGFGRRALVRNSMIAAVVASVAPGIVLFRGLAPFSSEARPLAGDPVALLSHTMWKEGTRLAHDPEGTPIRAADVTLGSAVHVIPEDLAELGHTEGYLEEKAKAIVLLMRLLPEDLIEDARARPTGRTTASSPTRRCARTSAARSRCTSSRRTTCCARATSRSSTSRTAPRSSSDPPPVPCRSCRSPSTPRATSSHAATSPNPSARASGSAIEYLNSPRGARSPGAGGP